MAHAQRRIAVRLWLEEERKWANALLSGPSQQRVMADPLLAALAARQAKAIRRRRSALPGDRTIIPCGLKLAAT